MLFEMPCEFGVPPGPPIKLIAGDTMAWLISRNGRKRVSPTFSASSWLPTVRMFPLRLHCRPGDVTGPHRSLYVTLEMGSTWKYSAGGLPDVRQTSVVC